ncbi:RGS17 [Bugula neritina]|uniref:RGS17 n=1 Tax=Bugula neritina TaxID=10212 RepID=A0A7J7K6J5_BUGNE|nr:RGS17 [Bugula neritina]KAF6034240.1 RGS17 [Bugula neritina]
MKSRYNVEEVIEWGKSFNSLLASKDGRELFRIFLKKEFSQENILFYEACEELDLLVDEQEIFEKTRLIYEDYVSTLADREVSLDSVIRDEIQVRMINPSKDMFKSAREHIYNLMMRDSYPRFKNSEIYRKTLDDCRQYIER